MQHEQRPAQFIRRPTRLIKHPYPFDLGNKCADQHDVLDVATLPTAHMEAVKDQGDRIMGQGYTTDRVASPVYSRGDPCGRPGGGLDAITDPTDIASQSTAHLMQLSGMMRAIRL